MHHISLRYLIGTGLSLPALTLLIFGYIGMGGGFLVLIWITVLASPFALRRARSISGNETTAVKTASSSLRLPAAGRSSASHTQPGKGSLTETAALRSAQLSLFVHTTYQLPASSFLAPVLVLGEDPTEKGLSSLYTLFEEFAYQSPFSTLLLTTNAQHVALAAQNPHSFLIGAPAARSLLRKYAPVHKDRTRFLPMEDMQEICFACERLLQRSEPTHAIFLISSYEEATQAYQVLSWFLATLQEQQSRLQRKILLGIAQAEIFLPKDHYLGHYLFPNREQAKSIKEHLLFWLKATRGRSLLLFCHDLTELDPQVLQEVPRWFLISKHPWCDPLATEEALDELTLLAQRLKMAPAALQQMLTQGTLIVDPHYPDRATVECLRASTLQVKTLYTPFSWPAEPLRLPGPGETQASAPQETPLDALLSGFAPAYYEYLAYLVINYPSQATVEHLQRPPHEFFSVLEMLGLREEVQRQGYIFPQTQTEALVREAIAARSNPEMQERAQSVTLRHLRYTARFLNQDEGSEGIFKNEEIAQPATSGVDTISVSEGKVSTRPTGQPLPHHVVPGGGEQPITSLWKVPATTLLQHPTHLKVQEVGQDLLSLAKKIQGLLQGFKVDAEVRQEDISIGPTIIRFGIRPTGKPEMRQDAQTRKMVPVRDAAGNLVYVTRTRVKQILALQNDLALALEARTIRMEAPVPGQAYVGVEIPNKNSRLVTLREVLETKEYQAAKGKSKLAIGLGKDVGGVVRVGDLAKMPHLLIAGATGSGKSVCVNTIIASILTQATPDDVRLLMVDPKMVELNMYNGIPHLLAPVVTEVEKVVPLLKNAINEMERRYRLFSQLGVRNLDGYRKLRIEKIARGDTSLKNLPAIVIIIDELADLMMAAPEEVEGMICRLAQLARATGIHLVVATQRPSVDVITGLIKANIPTRISFMVSSQVDSRTIIDMGGAERLLGRGDMLYLPADAGRPERIQGAFLADEEAQALVHYWKEQITLHAAMLDRSEEDHVVAEPSWEIRDAPDEDVPLDDDLLDKAEEIVREYGKASISLLQGRLRIGYSRAARLIELLEEHGIIRQAKGDYQVSEEEQVGRPFASENSSETFSSSEEEERPITEDLKETQADRSFSDERGETPFPPHSQFVPSDVTDFRKTLQREPLFQAILHKNEHLMNRESRGGEAWVVFASLVAYIFREERVSTSLLTDTFLMAANTASKHLQALTVDHHILRPHAGGNAPRQLTEDRGGELLDPLLLYVRQQVEKSQGTLEIQASTLQE